MARTWTANRRHRRRLGGSQPRGAGRAPRRLRVRDDCRALGDRHRNERLSRRTLACGVACRGRRSCSGSPTCMRTGLHLAWAAENISHWPSSAASVVGKPRSWGPGSRLRWHSSSAQLGCSRRGLRSGWHLGQGWSFWGRWASCSLVWNQVRPDQSERFDLAGRGADRVEPMQHVNPRTRPHRKNLSSSPLRDESNRRPFVPWLPRRG